MLIVEDGTGLVDAESFISVADADAYFTEHGSPASWTALLEPAKESALRYATLWVDRRYVWPGVIEFPDTPQALSWPRLEAYDADGRALEDVPQEVEDATCEAALAHIAGTLAEVRDRDGAIQSATVGPLSVTYATGAPSGRTFPFIDAILSRIAQRKGAGGIELIRG